MRNVLALRYHGNVGRRPWSRRGWHNLKLCRRIIVLVVKVCVFVEASIDKLGRFLCGRRLGVIAVHLEALPQRAFSLHPLRPVLLLFLLRDLRVGFENFH